MSARLQHPVGDPGEIPSTVVSAQTVQGALDRILASDVFRNARRPSQFLRFIVESALADKEKRIKEYLIGVEVFERPADYDPKSDPVVRIEAGRLRKKLSEYYAGSGANDPIIVELPKGGYIPTFRARPYAQPAISESEHLAFAKPRPVPLDPVPSSPWLRLIALCGVLALAVLVLYYVRHRRAQASAPTAIAVLPFLNLSADPDAGAANEYLSDGIAEELTTGLAQLRGLRVVASTSAFQFRGKSEDVRKIGHALNADALLEGSVSQSSDGFRINAQLIDARNGYHMWSKIYSARSSDILASEQDIVEQIARVLQVPATDGLRPMKLDTENLEAHDLYLQGRYLWSKRDLADMQESARLFERATKLDPNYALAHVGLADAYTVMAANEQISPADALPRARAALQRALELDPNLAQAHATLGLLKSQCEWDWHGAEQEFRRAIELQPNYAEAHHWAGLNYMTIGEFSAAETEFRQAQVLDPLSLMITEGLEENFYYSRRYDDAIATGLGIPGRRIGSVTIASAYISKGMYEEALGVANQWPEGDLVRVTFTAEITALSGNRTAGLKMLADLERHIRNSGAVNGYASPARIGFAYAVIGEKQQALAWLEKAYQQHDPVLTPLKVSPAGDSLRSDARFEELLRKMGLSN
jgi:TolB-like protein/Tfp pilus assembly protein PilF